MTRLSRHRGLVVLLTPLEPSAIEESCCPLGVLAQRHRVVLASVSDPALTQAHGRWRPSVYDAAAAERTIALRQRTATALGQLGVEVIDADPEHLPAALADHYLLLKSRGLL